jgi:hypothetical protein
MKVTLRNSVPFSLVEPWFEGLFGRFQNREGVEKFVPAFWGFFRVRSFGCGLVPVVQFYRHGGEKLPLFHAVQQMFAVGSATGISGRPDLNRRHKLADGVDDLLGNALGFCGARLGFFEAGVKLAQGLFL